MVLSYKFPPALITQVGSLAIKNILEESPHRPTRDVRVQLPCVQVPQILCSLRLVVSTNTPRVIILVDDLREQSIPVVSIFREGFLNVRQIF